MTLPASGQISFNAINTELRVPATSTASLNQASYRTLAGVPSGAISLSNFYGKSHRIPLSYTFSSHTANASLNVSTLSGYLTGLSDITVTVGSGIYLYSTSTGTPGLTLSGGSSGDTLQLVNNGFIMGMGGVGGTNNSGAAGGIALQLGYPTTVNNTNGAAYIGGGGGGGYSDSRGGGGGAGGGPGGTATGTGGGAGGAGGGIGAIGAKGAGRNNAGGNGGGSGGGGGVYSVVSAPRAPSTIGSGAGGGGGRIFPGVGGLDGNNATARKGGDANQAGARAGDSGGGGGWGASGGSGSGGGRAVYLAGHTVTWVSGNTTRVYGAVSN